MLWAGCCREFVFIIYILKGRYYRNCLHSVLDFIPRGGAVIFLMVHLKRVQNWGNLQQPTCISPALQKIPAHDYFASKRRAVTWARRLLTCHLFHDRV